MRLYIIAGEASGDLHGAHLVESLYSMCPDLQIRAWGGDRMEKAGAELRKHYHDLAFMGFVEVLLNLRKILRNLRFCKKDILEFAPDAVVLIDYPGFNLKVAKWAKKEGIPVIYYIAPQVWAWHKSRVALMRQVIDRLLVILPFEKAFFAQQGIEAEYVGHPLVDALRENADPAYVCDDPRPLVALLPGSRRQEIKDILPQQLSVIQDFPQYHFVIAGTPPFAALYKHLMGDQKVDIVYDQTYSLLRSAQAALVKSGTATLETALLGIPEVVCYKGNPLSYSIAKRVIDIRYISLVNLILDQPVVTELIQKELSRENLKKELSDLMGPKGEEQKRHFDDLRQLLGEVSASYKAAQSIIHYITSNA